MSAYQIFVSDYFVSGLVFSSIVLAALLRRRLLTPSLAGPAGDSAPKRRGAAGWASVVFAAVFLSRLLVVDSILDPSFVYQDESSDSCIDPLRQKLGIPTAYDIPLQFSFARIVLETVGFEPTALRLFHAFRFALALALFVFFLSGGFRASALGVAALLAASYPYLWHSLWAASIGSGALPSLLVFGILLRDARISKAAAIAIGAVAAPSLYLYPGATLAIASLLFFHVFFYRERWSLVALALVAVSGLASKALFDWIYGTPFLGTSYAGGSFSFQYLGEALRVTPLDLFYRTTSFNSHNLGGPYFEPVLLWALALGILSRDRFFWFCVCVLALNVVLVGFTGPYPGVRRAMWSLPLLYLGCLHASLLFAERTSRLAPWVRGAFLASLALVCARDVVIGRSHFPVYAIDRFYEPAAAFLARHAPVEPQVVVFEDPHHEFRSHPYWCALGFTRGLWPPGRMPTIIPKDAPYPAWEEKDHWVLMQPTDTFADLERVFGPREREFLYPPEVPPALRDVSPHPSPLRVVRVR